jgi:hypothetical protein
MTKMKNQMIINELELLSNKIEQNTATLDDYRRYELLLLNGGLSHDYIYSYLNRVGFNTWEDFISARQQKERDKNIEASVVGGLIGLGLGLLLVGLFGKK